MSVLYVTNNQRELNDKMSTFLSMCFILNELIEALMGKVSLMTKREMKKHIEQLESFPTLGLLPYDYLYFAFDELSEFDNEEYNPFSDSETETEEETELATILQNKKRKQGVTFLKLSKDNLQLIQQYARSINLQRVNRFLSYGENRFVHHYWATNEFAHESVGLRGFIDRDIIFALACHMRFSHQNTFSLARLCREWMNTAFMCHVFSLHHLPTYDLLRPYHDIYPFPLVRRFNPLTNHTRFHRSSIELSYLRKLNTTQMCFGCRHTSCCNATIYGNDHCEHKKGCPFSLWVRRLNSFQEVVVVTDLALSRMCDTIQNLGSQFYECNLRLDFSTFNVNMRGGALFQGRGGVGGIKMETIIRYFNITQFNVYFD